MTVKKRNQTFQWLEALAILMVIDDHMNTRIGILSSIFPYNSFYMPMFVFISGYFYKQQAVIPNVKHKIQHLLIPYIVWAFIGDFIAYILMRCGIVNWYVTPFNIKHILRLLLLEPFSSITDAAWFVVMLFWVSIGYNILNLLFHLDEKKHSYVWLVLSVILGFVSLKLCMMGYNSNALSLFALRTVWYLQFYHMGRMFKLHWEPTVQKWRLLYTCSVCVAINVILTCIMGERINFYSTANMGNFNSCWIPLITSITGTLFWYKIMQMLSTKVGQVNIIDFIAENTFTIMECHLMFVNIPNFFAYYQYLHRNPSYLDFPVKTFKLGSWVRYSPNMRLIGWIFGVLGSMLVAYLIQQAKKSIVARRKIEKV